MIQSLVSREGKEYWGCIVGGSVVLYRFSGGALASVPEPLDSVLGAVENVGPFTSEQT